ncbi:rod shape-determining protein MreC [Oceanidesulfovibrio marinus]|uniref:Cell shape-determining protein MreC n=1 Tax=Oceanidesulfovibrio marinus TaxID=370038 RepID=A0ABX6NH33_9BACT|nr:rod shape-determining protein MreC [Oceanidesulfovibrio marinus]
MNLVPRRLAVALFVVLFLYLTLYTWNLRTGYLDKLSTTTGLTFVGLILKPADWVRDSVSDLWHRYVYLVDVQKENTQLRGQVRGLNLELARHREGAAELRRLRKLLQFDPPPAWRVEGARVLSRRVGPYAVLETLVVDKGSHSKLVEDMPAVTDTGVVGRVFRVAPLTSQVLLVTDPNSRIAVLGQQSRTSGIVIGQGANKPLAVAYVPLNAPLYEGEILVTSGFAGVFPKGLPVARVQSIRRSDISLFQKVVAEPLVAPRALEEILLLEVVDESEAPEAPTGNASRDVMLDVDALVDQLLSKDSPPEISPELQKAPGEPAPLGGNSTGGSGATGTGSTDRAVQ